MMQALLRDAYGDDAETPLDLKRISDSSRHDQSDAIELVRDVVLNKGECVEAIRAYILGTWDAHAPSSADEFSIELRRFGPVFWVQAPVEEHDALGYFGSLDEARAAANAEYQVFIAPWTW